MSPFQCRAPLAFAVMGAYRNPWPRAEHREGLSYSSGADKTFSVVTRECEVRLPKVLPFRRDRQAAERAKRNKKQ